jgi:hypothetical protein
MRSPIDLQLGDLITKIMQRLYGMFETDFAKKW